ncbi:DUF4435 domain-containing protein [Pectobacterium brasiliense]|uniref:DUF4435 domain-containing protein n=1 Tax=Pectobacterium brasiliense TaxID=180957 RepID=UPI0019695C3F|nr:DUF4435 domain-containing protein [Pectobacterium brasiliense]MBN3198126.1 DUF4435 domain-containing protein [Pectobacterium brasiliense]
MKYVIGEILNEAIMTDVPAVIVEGIDDVRIYDDICKSLNDDYFVLPIECVDGYSEGNEQVIKAMDSISSLPTSAYEYCKYVVGIIDKDVRDYRGELPENNLVFPLSYYSMESHFINKTVLRKLLSDFTRITNDLLADDLIDYLYSSITSDFDDLYLLSLEALKGAIDSEYASDFSYSFNEGRVTNNVDIEKIRYKRLALLSFAEDMNIDYSIESIKKIAKGKWVIYLFCFLLEKKIHSLPDKCHSQEIASCRTCVANIQKCLYKIREGVTHRTLRSTSFSITDSDDFSYVRNRLKLMRS